MTIQEAIEARHSVRAYKDQPLSEVIVKDLEDEILKLNNEGQLHIQLICNEPKAFQGTMGEGKRIRRHGRRPPRIREAPFLGTT